MPLSNQKKDKSEFSVNIKRKRLSQGRSQEEVAEMVGVDGSSVTSWEAEETIPREGNAKKLAEVLGDPIGILALWRYEKWMRGGAQLTPPHILKDLSVLLSSILKIHTDAEPLPGSRRDCIVNKALLKKTHEHAENIKKFFDQTDTPLKKKMRKKRKTKKK